MSGCCDPRGCDKVFGPRFAHHVAARYRKRGLDRTAQRMVDWIVSQGIDGASVLEIGGGVGEVGLELLARGAARATTLELTPAYDDQAAALAAEAGLAGRVHRRLGDVAADSSVADEADIVVMHRVICCYPDAERLLSAAADHTRRLLALSHPPRNPVSRSMVAVENLGLRLLRREYRMAAHPPSEMLRVLHEDGFRSEHLHRGPVWQVLAATRG